MAKIKVDKQTDRQTNNKQTDRKQETAKDGKAGLQSKFQNLKR